MRVADTTLYRDSRDDVGSFGFAQLAVGDFVELGLVELDGVLTATKVERDDRDDEQYIEARVDSIDGLTETLEIAGVAVDALARNAQALGLRHRRRDRRWPGAGGGQRRPGFVAHGQARQMNFLV